MTLRVTLELDLEVYLDTYRDEGREGIEALFEADCREQVVENRSWMDEQVEGIEVGLCEEMFLESCG